MFILRTILCCSFLFVGCFAKSFSDDELLQIYQNVDRAGKVIKDDEAKQFLQSILDKKVSIEDDAIFERAKLLIERSELLFSMEICLSCEMIKSNESLDKIKKWLDNQTLLDDPVVKKNATDLIEHLNERIQRGDMFAYQLSLLSSFIADPEKKEKVEYWLNNRPLIYDEEEQKKIELFITELLQGPSQKPKEVSEKFKTAKALCVMAYSFYRKVRFANDVQKGTETSGWLRGLDYAAGLLYLLGDGYEKGGQPTDPSKATSNPYENPYNMKYKWSKVMGDDNSDAIEEYIVKNEGPNFEKRVSQKMEEDFKKMVKDAKKEESERLADCEKFTSASVEEKEEMVNENALKELEKKPEYTKNVDYLTDYIFFWNIISKWWKRSEAYDKTVLNLLSQSKKDEYERNIPKSCWDYVLGWRAFSKWNARRKIRNQEQSDLVQAFLAKHKSELYQRRILDFYDAFDNEISKSMQNWGDKALEKLDIPEIFRNLWKSKAANLGLQVVVLKFLPTYLHWFFTQKAPAMLGGKGTCSIDGESAEDYIPFREVIKSSGQLLLYKACGSLNKLLNGKKDENGKGFLDRMSDSTLGIISPRLIYIPLYLTIPRAAIALTNAFRPGYLNESDYYYDGRKGYEDSKKKNNNDSVDVSMKEYDQASIKYLFQKDEVNWKVHVPRTLITYVSQSVTFHCLSGLIPKIDSWIAKKAVGLMDFLAKRGWIDAKWWEEFKADPASDAAVGMVVGGLSIIPFLILCGMARTMSPDDIERAMLSTRTSKSHLGPLIYLAAFVASEYVGKKCGELGMSYLAGVEGYKKWALNEK